MHGPTKWMGAAAFAAAMMLGSAGNAAAQAAAGGAARPPDPPVIAYRKAMMQVNSQHQAALRALLSGQTVGTTDEDIEMHVEALANQGEMFSRIFPEGSTGPTSRAMDEIWTKKDEFAARVKAFADATNALKDTADKSDNAATLAALAAVGQTCGACHTPFRKPAAPPPAG